MEEKETSIDGKNEAEVPHSHGHHHHSHHHSHHHRGSKKRRSKNGDVKKKFKAFVKKNRGLLVNIFACSVAIVLLVYIAVDYDRDKDGKATGHSNNGGALVSESAIRLEIPLFPDRISLVSDPISEYMNGDEDTSAHDLWRDNKGDAVRLDNGRPLKFSYKIVGKPESVTVEHTSLEISKNKNYTDVRVYDIDGMDTIDVYNLEADTDYYYRLTLTLSDGMSAGAVGSFATAASPRVMNIDGVVNVRDIGGWSTVDGHRIKQGMLYRGAELDGLVESPYKLTDEGRAEMLVHLGVRFDMDLRSVADNPEGINALGESVSHVHYGVPAYSDILLDENGELLRSVFEDLADKNNYPVYMHCTYGRDRTGTVCYLLEALLGVSDEDLRRDYELSAFADGFADLEEFARFTTKIEHLEGATTKDKVEGYLLSVGVTPEQIANIREIFLSE